MTNIMHPKGTVIPLATTSECFNKRLHPKIHAGGNAWVKRVWNTLTDGDSWEYPVSADNTLAVRLIKREAGLYWEVA